MIAYTEMMTTHTCTYTVREMGPTEKKNTAQFFYRARNGSCR